MKKELFASVLTLTASMANARSFKPNFNLAQSTQIEAAFVKSILLKSEHKVRFTDSEGQFHLGHIYMELDSASSTPEYNNQLTGEMTGMLYFESDAYTSSWEGRKFKTVQSLVGDSGEFLLDMTNWSEESGSTYQVYGCNSTRTQCTGEAFEFKIGSNKSYTLDARFAAELKMEVGTTYDGKAYWAPRADSMKMIPVPAQK